MLPGRSVPPSFQDGCYHGLDDVSAPPTLEAEVDTVKTVTWAVAGPVEIGWFLGMVATCALAGLALTAIRVLGGRRGSDGSSSVVVDPLIATATTYDGHRVRVLATATLEPTRTAGRGNEQERLHRTASALESALTRRLGEVRSDDVASRLPSLCAAVRRDSEPVGLRYGVAVRGLEAYAAEIVLPVEPQPPQ
jgi:hypothetical protein